ncbi:hypothetical protein MY1884_007184 [Beauveria asiatica]
MGGLLHPVINLVVTKMASIRVPNDDEMKLMENAGKASQERREQAERERIERERIERERIEKERIAKERQAALDKLSGK